ncbi:MAG TPA: DUF3516 domain-containing protein, partial [Nocardioidaceae bacterium]|nr:DUF3516 domain-containing protein [Nocardioidaceae bacterium]
GRNGRPTATVKAQERPVPLEYEYSEVPLALCLERLVAEGKAPVYVVHFTQKDAADSAQAFTSLDLASREEKNAVAAAIEGFRLSSPYGPRIRKWLKQAIAVHHAGLLPKYRVLVEQLAQRGLLKVICGTDTLGVGINVPIRTVVLTGLTKYDGRRQRVLKAREFHQIAGRAGRAGYDTAGSVVVQAPDHVIENHKALKKAGDDPKKQRKVQRKKPPEGFVTWTEDTYQKLVASEPEPLQSRMRVTHGMLLNVVGRDGNPFEAMRKLLRDNHEDGRSQVRLVRRAVALYRTLLAAGVVEKVDPPGPDGRTVRLVEDLPFDFALNQPLSTYALATLETLDPESPTYALDVVSVVEATLEDPRPVLNAQEFKAKGEAVAEMKADGVEYDERMDLLEEISWPKPLQELLEHTYEVYRSTHPWIGETALSPKSVVRDMYERAMTFGEYVAFYGLARSEGIVLRYLGDAYKALRQTVPESMKDEALTDLIEWLGETVRQTDSSLLDEWEQLSHPADDPESAADLVRAHARPAQARPITANERSFRTLVRNAMFRRVELAARRAYEDLGELDPERGPDAETWREMVEAYFKEHDEIDIGPDARGPHMLLLEQEGRTWRVQQIVGDPEGHHDWRILAEVDLDASDEAGELVMQVEGLVQL